MLRALSLEFMDHLARRATVLACLVTMGLGLGGCAFGHLAGGMAQNFEYQKEIEVLPEYEDLDGKTVAVLANADLATLYEHPMLTSQVAGAVAGRLDRELPEARVLPARIVMLWQQQTPQWDAMAYGKMAESLNVDRVIYIDIYEYRLHPPGNSWEWQGHVGATVGVIERDAIDPDRFAEEFQVSASYPEFEEYLTKAEANARTIDHGLKSNFVKRCAWLFHKHLEPKYPRYYRPELHQEPKE